MLPPGKTSLIGRSTSTGASVTTQPTREKPTVLNNTWRQSQRALPVAAGLALWLEQLIRQKANNCSYAMRLSLITQCHSGQAQAAIGAAGEPAVCSYLKTK